MSIKRANLNLNLTKNQNFGRKSTLWSRIAMKYEPITFWSYEGIHVWLWTSTSWLEVYVVIDSIKIINWIILIFTKTYQNILLLYLQNQNSTDTHPLMTKNHFWVKQNWIYDRTKVKFRKNRQQQHQNFGWNEICTISVFPNALNNIEIKFKIRTDLMRHINNPWNCIQNTQTQFSTHNLFFFLLKLSNIVHLS